MWSVFQIPTIKPVTAEPLVIHEEAPKAQDQKVQEVALPKVVQPVVVEKKPENVSQLTCEKVLKSIQGGAGVILSVTGAVAGPVEYGKKIIPHFPEVVPTVLTSVSILALVPGLFAIPRFFSSIKKAFVEAEIDKKIKAVWASIRHAGTMLSAAIQTSQWLHFIKVVGKSAIGWVGKVVPALIALETVSAGTSIWQCWKNYKFYKELEAKIKAIDAKPPPKGRKLKRATLVGRALAMVAAQKKGALRAKFTLPKECKIKEATENLMKGVRKRNRKIREQSVRVGAKLVSELKERASTTLKWKVASCALKVVGVALLIFALFAFPIPTLFALAVIGLVGGCVMWYKRRKMRQRQLESLQPVPVPVR